MPLFCEITIPPSSLKNSDMPCFIDAEVGLAASGFPARTEENPRLPLPLQPISRSSPNWE